jgi:hypothetical protein
MVTVEYLLPFNTVDDICRDIKSFNSLLSSNSNISIKGNKIIYMKSAYDYTVELNEVENQSCSVFHITLTIGRKTDKFRNLIKAIKRTIGTHLKDDIQIIWDGIGFEWSTELYPKIYKIENSMRKLISKFMLTQLGIGWHKLSVPKEVKDSIKNSLPNGQGILYESDFIQLSNFLFSPYSVRDTAKLPEMLGDLLEGEVTEDKKNEILEFIPNNNWDRYFSSIVDCDSEQLKKKWQKLYDIRCIVAHNKPMKFDEYKEGTDLVEFLEPIINSAIENVTNIEIPEEDKETVSLNTMATVHAPTRVFIDDYYRFNNGLTGTIISNQDAFPGITIKSNPITSILDSSTTGTIKISDDFKDTLVRIESNRDTILGGESYNALKAVTDNSTYIFRDASNQFLSNFKGVIPTTDMSSFVSGPTGAKSEDENGED